MVTISKGLTLLNSETSVCSGYNFQKGLLFVVRTMSDPNGIYANPVRKKALHFAFIIRDVISTFCACQYHESGLSI
jgi:hypothetical protein